MFRIAISSLTLFGVFLVPNVLCSQEGAVTQERAVAQERAVTQQVTVDPTSPHRATFIVGSKVRPSAKPYVCSDRTCETCSSCQGKKIVDLAVATHTASAIGTVQQAPPSEVRCNNVNCSHCQSLDALGPKVNEETPVPIYTAKSTNRLIAEQLAQYIVRNQCDVDEIQRAIEQSLNYASQSATQRDGQVHMSLSSDTPPPARPFYPPARQLKTDDDMVELREMVKQNQRQVTMLARRIEEMQSNPTMTPGQFAHDTVEQNHHIAMLRARVAELESQLANQRLTPAPIQPVNHELTPVMDPANNPLRPEGSIRPVVMVPVDDGIVPETPVATARRMMQEPQEPNVMISYNVTDLAQLPYFETVIALVQYIQSQVDPGNWDEGSVRIFATGRSGISLIISQNESNHAKISDLLESMRARVAEFIEQQNSLQR